MHLSADKQQWKNNLLKIDNSSDELFPNMDPDIKSLLLNKFKDTHIRTKLLEEIFGSMKLVVNNLGD